jgi:hypothetical protein
MVRTADVFVQARMRPLPNSSKVLLRVKYIVKIIYNVWIINVTFL